MDNSDIAEYLCSRGRHTGIPIFPSGWKISEQLASTVQSLLNAHSQGNGQWRLKGAVVQSLLVWQEQARTYRYSMPVSYFDSEATRIIDTAYG